MPQLTTAFRHIAVVWIALMALCTALPAQPFTRVSDPANPVATVQLEDYWTGGAWVDYDGDLDLDLFLTNRVPGRSQRTNKLFRNDGGGAFTEVTTGPLVSDFGYWFGATWGDYDNDGDPDCHVAGLPARLYRNDGGGAFTPILTGDIAANSLAGISSAWGDYDSDGHLDLLVVRPNWLQGPPVVGPPGPPRLLHNDGSGAFTDVDAGPISAHGTDSYLHVYWTDYDDDGDADLFLSRGSGAPLPDLPYRNRLAESGSATFEPINGPVFATDSIEGNQWSWIDIDNDGDRDAFVTCWATAGPPFTPAKNRLYRNDGGVWSRVSGDPIVTDAHPSVAHTWADTDNDGDLDCIVTTDSTYALQHYLNNGDGTFSKSLAGDLPATVAHQAGITLGDYDGDGDLDAFVMGPGESRALFRNDLAPGRAWVRIRLDGTASNRSGIGATVRAHATIGGQEIRQRRDLSAASGFFGHNSLDIHFGFGDATVIDTLHVAWPSGAVDVHTDVPVNRFYQAREGGSLDPLTAIESSGHRGVPDGFHLEQNHPNPFNPETRIAFTLPSPARVTVTVFDLAGRKVVTLLEENRPAGRHEVPFAAGGLPSGTYIYRVRAGGQEAARKMVYMK